MNKLLVSDKNTRKHTNVSKQMITEKKNAMEPLKCSD